MLDSNYNEILRVLRDDLSGSDARKSSHWQKYTQDRRVSETEIIGISGFGNAAKRSRLRQTVHDAFQRYLVGLSNPVFSSGPYHAADRYCTAQNRALDMDVLRHVFTMTLLKRLLPTGALPDCVCIIGDGQANFVSAALSDPSAPKVISINLVDVLMSDLMLLAMLPGMTASSFAVVRDKNGLAEARSDPQVRVILLAAHRVDLLRAEAVPLFVNIASFQEMSPDVVEEYFDVMRSNKSHHYNCNRLRKVLPGGEVLAFEHYPWGDARILLDEPCPWHQRFYAFRWPFIRTYDGPTHHRFVQF
ncbi:MAG: hypothetical protein JJ908_00245 [Rhizobiales bacterium]|nr:hypothetical protein [Hyphomicrobiales bacterium]MBO6698973.1 hypothetical protein [Hyphomicrobiales bacterium]MBO6734774.1 hypothetical protein [Hyphomicrobiales bacterium]MBO6911420.1 hypothetical protein [Hyphomicrobiales bacterium]MBO6955447.1 hypothetical protein [Hyphomicrobiales bacterium]